MKLFSKVFIYMEFANNMLDGFYSLTTSPNQLLGTFVSLCLVLYGGLAGPKLPKVFKQLFENTYFKFFILSLVAYSSVKDYKVSLLLAFLLSLSVSLCLITDTLLNASQN